MLVNSIELEQALCPNKIVHNPPVHSSPLTAGPMSRSEFKLPGGSIKDSSLAQSDIQPQSVGKGGTVSSVSTVRKAEKKIGTFPGDGETDLEDYLAHFMVCADWNEWSESDKTR